MLIFANQHLGPALFTFHITQYPDTDAKRPLKEAAGACVSIWGGELGVPC